MGSLTQKQISLIIGSILGDGYAHQVPGRRDAYLEINHSINAQAYVDWKFNILQNISHSAPKSRQSNGSRIAYRFTTRQHPEITKLYNAFYEHGKKGIPNFKLDPFMLAVWFMDDGSKCRKYDVYLNTQQFTFTDQHKLINILSTLGLETRINKDKQYYRLRFFKRSVKRLNELIAPYIIPSMKYKLSYDPVETSA